MPSNESGVPSAKRAKVSAPEGPPPPPPKAPRDKVFVIPPAVKAPSLKGKAKAKEAATETKPSAKSTEAKPEAAKAKPKAKSKRGGKGGAKPKVPHPTLGFYFSHAGVAMAWGEGSNGQLGYEAASRKVPGIIPSFKEKGILVHQAEAGGMHTAYLTTEGKVYTCGVNDEGALGRHTKHENPELADLNGLTPTVVNYPEKIVQVACGDSHTAVLSESGKVYQQGNYRCEQGKYGIVKEDNRPRIDPMLILDLGQTDQVVKIGAGLCHTMALSRKGKVYTWGCHEGGILGRMSERTCRTERADRREVSLKPGIVDFPGKKKIEIKDIYTGGNACFARSEDTVYAWGSNDNGQLGIDWVDTDPSIRPRVNPDANRVFTPEPVALLKDKKIISIECGGIHSVFVSSDGNCYSCGDGKYGKLGHTNYEEGTGNKLEDAERNSYDRKTGKNQLMKVAHAKKVKKIAVYDSCSLLIDEDGLMFGWGFGDNNQLGNAIPREDITPCAYVPGKVKSTKVVNLSARKVFMASLGGQHSLLVASMLPEEAEEQKKNAEEASSKPDAKSEE